MRAGTCTAIAFAAAMLVLSCSAAREIAPTPERPVRMCYISCPYGYAFEAQHLCRSGTRWFQNVVVKGEHTVRGADGTKLVDVWITDQGDYPKIDLVAGSCESFIASSCAMSGACAAHPGEPDPRHGFGDHR